MHSVKWGTSGIRIPKNCHGLLNLVVFILVIKTSNKAVTLNEILWMETVTLPEDVCCWRLWSTRSTSRWAGSVAGRQLQQVVRRRWLLSLSRRGLSLRRLRRLGTGCTLTLALRDVTTFPSGLPNTQNTFSYCYCHTSHTHPHFRPTSSVHSQFSDLELIYTCTLPQMSLLSCFFLNGFYCFRGKSPTLNWH